MFPISSSLCESFVWLWLLTRLTRQRRPIQIWLWADGLRMAGFGRQQSPVVAACATSVMAVLAITSPRITLAWHYPSSNFIFCKESIQWISQVLGGAGWPSLWLRIKVTNQSVAQVTLLNGSCATGSYRKVDRPSANAIYYNAMLYTTAEALYTGDMQLGISTDAKGTDMAVSEAVYGYYKLRT